MNAPDNNSATKNTRNSKAESPSRDGQTAERQPLESAQVELASIPCPRFGLSPITTFSDGSYEPAETGRKAVILAVEDDDGDPYDALAFYGKQPDRWWLRYSQAIALGLGAIEQGYVTDQPVRIVANPAIWIAARGNAVCILDWTADIYALLSLAPRIVCDTPALAGKVRRAINRPRLDIAVRRAA